MPHRIRRSRRKRIALARIISDMIKADNIIEYGEIEEFKKFKEDFAIDSDCIKSSVKLKFSEAVMRMADLASDLKSEIYNRIKSMSIADGLCVHHEAMLLIALWYCFNSDNKIKRPKLISCRIKGDSTVDNKYIIYIEGQKNDTINQEIENNFEVQFLKLQNIGFDFIYIPALVREFKNMQEQYVKEVIEFMAPELNKPLIESVYDRLLNIDTVSFCNNVMAEKLNVDSIKYSDPSLLINIGTYPVSDNLNDNYTEFLCIPLYSGFSELIESFINVYKSLIPYDIIPRYTTHTSITQFRYFGFYKALFDFIVKAEPKPSYMLLYKNNNEIYFPECNNTHIRLQPQLAAVYKLIVYLTYDNQIEGLPTENSYYQRRFETLYRHLLVGTHETNLPTEDALKVVISKINSEMKRELRGLANLDSFLPVNIEGHYKIKAPRELICVNSKNKDISDLLR